MIAIVDSGVANLGSVCAALRRLGAEAVVTDDPRLIAQADRVILPGVGAADAAMQALRSKNLGETLRNLTQPLLGICLGMQILFERSQENDGVDGLGLLAGHVQALPSTPERPTPHMGWNQCAILRPDHPLLRAIPDDSFVYYVHSFAAPANVRSCIALTTYTASFAAVVAQNNFLGCQFHPERSGAIGEKILKNFLLM